MQRTNELHDYCRRGHLHIPTNEKEMIFKYSHSRDLQIQALCEYCRIQVWLTKQQFLQIYDDWKKAKNAVHTDKMQ